MRCNVTQTVMLYDTKATPNKFSHILSSTVACRQTVHFHYEFSSFNFQAINCLHRNIHSKQFSLDVNPRITWNINLCQLIVYWHINWINFSTIMELLELAVNRYKRCMRKKILKSTPKLKHCLLFWRYITMLQASFLFIVL